MRADKGNEVAVALEPPCSSKLPLCYMLSPSPLAERTATSRHRFKVRPVVTGSPRKGCSGFFSAGRKQSLVPRWQMVPFFPFLVSTFPFSSFSATPFFDFVFNAASGWRRRRAPDPSLSCHTPGWLPARQARKSDSEKSRLARIMRLSSVTERLLHARRVALSRQALLATTASCSNTQRVVLQRQGHPSP